MKRKFIILSMVAVVIFSSLTPMTTFAQNEKVEYKINSVSELEKIVDKENADGEISQKEGEAIVEETEPIILEKYISDKIEIMKETLSQKEFVLDDNENSKEYNVETPDGGEITVLLEDKAETSSLSEIPRMVQKAAGNKTGSTNTMFKAVGDWYFTGHCYYQNGFVAICLKLRNHYTVTPQQTLKARYTGVDTLAGISLYCSNSINSTEWTSKTATKVGKYINCRVEIKSEVGAAPKGTPFKTSKYYYVNSRVKLISKTTSGGKKGVKVQQSLQWTK